MQCIHCGYHDTRVIDSRSVDQGASIRRRRECPKCSQRFTTYETAERQMPRIVKSSGARETFNEEKLRGGMLRALEKRAVSTERIDQSIEQIKRSLQTLGKKEIPARMVGDLVMKALLDLDEVAYIRFASVYLSFDNADAFREMIENLPKEVGGRSTRQMPLPEFDPDSGDSRRG